MIKEREPALERISVLIQVAYTILCFFFVLWATGRDTQSFLTDRKPQIILSLLIIPIWFGFLELFELGKMARIQRYRQIIRKYILVVAGGTITLSFLAQVLNYEWLTTDLLLTFALVNFLVLTIQKLTGRSIIKYLRRKGYNTRLLLIIADETSKDFIRQISETEEWGYRIRGIMTDSDDIIKEFGGKYSIYSEKEEFTKIIDERVIDEVFYCKQQYNAINIQKLIHECREVGISFHIHNKVLSFNGLSPKLHFLNQQFFISFRNTPENYLALKVKETLDFFLSIIFITLISPVMVGIAIAIKLDDGGPVFFKQTRVGRHGRLFKCIKFRTMIINAEEVKEKIISLNEQDGPVFKIKNDPRITRVGQFLRKTSLDELPQFFNVLAGDMSIVGPRPPIPEEVKQYQRHLKRRLSINPGITCIWQVSGRNNVPFDKWMEMDMQYIDNWSLRLDFIIMLKTVKVIFERNGQ
ncbi:MAG TPA: sugar transferase [Mariniphaga sp.]|nr:sugar transferase [Mariniphaga sp.]